MNFINKLVEQTKQGNQEAKAQIVIRMSPLIKKYALKIHFMEYEDAEQELYISLIECIPYLDYNKDESKLLKYMEQTIIHKYYFLCKKNLSLPEMISTDMISYEMQGKFDNGFEQCEWYLDLKKDIKEIYKQDATRAKIVYLSIMEYTDKEIALLLGLSRQYVNRVKKMSLAKYKKSN